MQRAYSATLDGGHNAAARALGDAQSVYANEMAHVRPVGRADPIVSRLEISGA